MRSRLTALGKRARRTVFHARAWQWFGFGALCLLYGFAVNWYGAYTWDDSWQYAYGQYLYYRFGLISQVQKPTLLLFGPLTELFLGIWTEYVFPWLKDPYLVRHAVVAAFYVFGLAVTWKQLRVAGLHAVTASLAIALIFADIRLFGHSLTSVKDAPAAIIYLLATVALWNALAAERKAHKASLARVAGISLLCISVYLVRTPLLLHTVLAIVGFWFILFNKHKRTQRDWLTYGLLPAALSLVVVAALFPTAWDRGLSTAVANSVAMYAHHPWRGTTQIFGILLYADKIPWWYPFPWVAVIMEPFAFVLIVLGLFHYVPKTLLQLRSRFAFEQWVLLVTVLSWSAVCIITPVLYSDERHIAFLYPLLGICAALGLRQWQKTWQKTAAGLSVCLSLIAILQWGYQSYVYTNPVAAKVINAGFDGDYWGSCIAQAITELPNYAPAESAIWVQFSNPVQHQRLQHSLVRKMPNYPAYQFTGARPKVPNFYTVVYHGTGRDRNFITQLEADIAKGLAKEQWRLLLPTGQTACMIASYGNAPSPAKP